LVGLCVGHGPIFFGELLVDEAGWKHVDEVVATGDGDRYVATFFAPAPRQRALLALYAFDLEVSRVGLTVREPMAGHIRLAWWREQVAATYSNGALQAPVAEALAEAVRAHGLPRALFDHYLDARALDLEEAPFDDEAAMEAHARAVGGGIVQLAVRVLGGGDRADVAASHAGTAMVYAAHLNDAAMFAARRRCRFPVSWLADVGVNAEDLFAARQSSPALSLLFMRMRERVRAELRSLNRARFPMAALPALAAATLTRRAASDPFSPSPVPPWQKFARIVFANLAWRV
jgi:phytoene/squalene synthetase